MQAHPDDHFQLLLERIDMLFLVGEDLGEQVAAGIVADALAVRDGALQLLDRFHLELEVGAEDFLDRLANAQAPEHLEIGETVEEQNSLGQPVGMLHLVDRLVPLEFGELLDALIVEQPIMQPILIDRGQLILERLVKQLDDLCIALHVTLL